MKIALLISGGGTTMEAIIKATRNGTLVGVLPVLVIASNENAGGIEKAHNLGINDADILVINPKDFSSREDFGQKIIEECQKREVDFIGQYGFMVMTPENVINTYEGRIVNQHPGPLDTRPYMVGGQVVHLDFGGAGMYGLRVHQARIEFVKKVNRDFWTEATCHRVTAEFDQGAILKRREVPIQDDDTAESLQERVLPMEHAVQIETLQDFANNNVKEWQRENPLVLSDEEGILEECKQIAIKMYPKG